MINRHLPIWAKIGLFVWIAITVYLLYLLFSLPTEKENVNKYEQQLKELEFKKQEVLKLKQKIDSLSGNLDSLLILARKTDTIYQPDENTISAIDTFTASDIKRSIRIRYPDSLRTSLANEIDSTRP